MDWSFAARYWVEAGFGVVAAALAFAYRSLFKRAKASKTEQDAIKTGVQALLRDRVIQLYNHNLERGYCPIYSLDAANDLYKAYKSLGGNGTVTRLIEELGRMPTEKKE